MPNLSVITIAGHLGRDAELKAVSGQAVCEFSMAVTHKRGRDDGSTTWYRASVWGARAEKLAPMLTKGKAVLVVGDLIPREYRGKNDELRVSLDVRVNSIEFLGGAAERGEDRPTSSGRPAPQPAPADDDQIPF